MAIYKIKKPSSNKTLTDPVNKQILYPMHIKIRPAFMFFL